MINILADGTLPFTVALAVMISIGIIEAASLLFGMSISGAIDSVMPDLDPPGIDGIGEHPSDLGPLSHLLSWLSVGRVPSLILLVLFLTSFGLTGYAIQGIWQSATGSMLAAGVASVPAAVVGIIGMSRIGALVARILPKDQSYIADRHHFNGAVATIIRGEARLGRPAEAKATDLNDNTHYMLVEPVSPDTVWVAGDKAVILRHRAGTQVYQATTDLPAITKKNPANG